MFSRILTSDEFLNLFISQGLKPGGEEKNG
jgi:hypothetical protein